MAIPDRTDVVWMDHDEPLGRSVSAQPFRSFGWRRWRWAACCGRAGVRPVDGGADIGDADDRRILRRDGRGKSGTDQKSDAWRGLDVGSPPDHAKAESFILQGICPHPAGTLARRPSWTEIAGLIEAGGRTRPVLPMRARRRRRHARAPRHLVLCQGDDATAALIEQFAANPTTSLFGTLSLWQGVDVPGASLSLVMIDRIPFPRPDDPLLTARESSAVAARGGNGFMAVAASHAALLAQGAGRLLRHTDDRGVVAVLDALGWPPPATAPICASLPPYWTTTDPVRVVMRARLCGRNARRRGLRPAPERP